MMWGRVNGMLGVSRAVGDHAYKDFDKPSAEHVVTASGDLTILPRLPDDQFVLLACDGLFDVLATGDALFAMRLPDFFPF